MVEMGTAEPLVKIGPPDEIAVARRPDGGAAGARRLRIDPPSGWQLVDVRELWRYRELLVFLKRLNQKPFYLHFHYHEPFHH